MTRVISLGAGVQSSAMLLMGLEGRFGDKPDVAVFCDTRWERRATYEWLDRLESKVAPFPIVRISAGDIREEAVRGGPWVRRDGRPFVTLPTYTRDGLTWAIGQGRRQCSKEYKIEPLRRWVRENHREAEVWIGISLDEAHRAKVSRVGYVHNRWTLLETLLSRGACADYLRAAMGKSAPDSACLGCPFNPPDRWAMMRVEAPDEFEEACAFDDALRHVDPLVEQFLHPSCRPLREITEFVSERQGRMFVDLFGNECEGVCGV